MEDNRILWIERAFVLVIVIVVSILFACSLTLPAKSSLLPRAACIITIVLLGIEVLQSNLFMKKKISRAPDALAILPLSYGGKIKVLIWLLLTATMIYFVGFLLSSFLGTAIYLRIFGHKNLLTSIIISLFFAGFIYVVFIVLAKFSLYSGLLFL